MQSREEVTMPHEFKGEIVNSKTSGAHGLIYTVKPEKRFSFLAGQFVMLYLNINSKEESRAYSIASTPYKDDTFELAIRVRADSVFTQEIKKQLAVGKSFKFRGPMGNFTYQKGDAGHLLMIAGGSGIAPLKSIIDTAVIDGADIILLYSSRRKEEIIYYDELVGESDGQLKVFFTLTREGREGFMSGRINAQVVREVISREKFPLDSDETKIYICGPPPMVKDIYEMLLQMGIPKEKVLREMFK